MPIRNLGSRNFSGVHMRTMAALMIIAAIASGCGSTAPASTPVPTAPVSAAAPTPTAAPTTTPAPQGPTLLRNTIKIRKVVGVESGAIALARNPASGEVFMLNPANGIYNVKLDDSGGYRKVVVATDIIAYGVPSGMAFGPDGNLFVVSNRTIGTNKTQAVIRKGIPAGPGFSWKTVAMTEPYPLSATPFDHLFNGIVVSPDGKWLYVNSGSRTDHGEIEDNKGAFPDTREIPLTARIFRLPADALDLMLPNDEAGLKEYVFARGMRNAYDLEFAPNGDLFASDNSPDADYPDELNLLQEGKHYGFPWRFGSQNNPQQFPDYDASKDNRLNQDFTAVKNGTYKNDPTFPKAPDTLTDPIPNRGPAAVQYRSDDGRQRDAASEDKMLTTFTPHRSPLGLVFASDPKMPADFRSNGNTLSAFILSWGSAGGTLTDRGQDLLQLQITKQGDRYEIGAIQIATGFKNPISAILIENRLYVLEFSKDSAIWELTFE